MLYGQVLSTDNAIAYQPVEINDSIHGIVRNSLPGEILVRIGAASTGDLTREVYALPLFPHITAIPLIGELVYLVQFPNGLDTTQSSRQFYYISNINVQSSRNINQLPWLHDKSTQGSTINSVNVTPNAKVPSTYSFIEKDIKPLQPYEGDIIYQDRFGSSLRFGSTIDKRARTPAGRSVYTFTPPWIGNTIGDPIITLTAGISDAVEGFDYTIESPRNDQSLIYLTTSQRINFATAQRNLGPEITSGTRFSNPQIILSSDRIVLNSKQDSIILAANETVSIATPDWATDMNTFFTMVEDMHTELKNLHTQVTSLTSQVNTLSTAVATFGAAQQTAAAAIVVAAPLAVAPGALGVATAAQAGAISGITTQLTTIKTKLTDIDRVMTSLKQ